MNRSFLELFSFGKSRKQPIEIISFEYLYTVDGSWANWGAWMICSSTCGEGVMRRDRSCSDPAPLGKGEVCGGYGTETRHCFQRPCASNTQDHFYILLVFL